MRPEIDVALSQHMQKRFKNKICKCKLLPKHFEMAHDWCCQECGGSHTENLCPEGKKKEVKK